MLKLKLYNRWTGLQSTAEDGSPPHHDCSGPVRSGPGLVCERNLTLLQSHLAGVMSFFFKKKRPAPPPPASSLSRLQSEVCFTHLLCIVRIQNTCAAHVLCSQYSTGQGSIRFETGVYTGAVERQNSFILASYSYWLRHMLCQWGT